MKTPMPMSIIGQQFSVQRALKNALDVLEHAIVDEERVDRLNVAVDDVKTILDHANWWPSEAIVHGLDLHEKAKLYDALDPNARGAEAHG